MIFETWLAGLLLGMGVTHCNLVFLAPADEQLRSHHDQLFSVLMRYDIGSFMMLLMHAAVLLGQVMLQTLCR